MPTGKPPIGRNSAASWMKRLWATFGWPWHKGSRWDKAVSATGYVRRQASGAPRSDRGDPQVNRSNPVTRKTRRILGFKQERMR